MPIAGPVWTTIYILCGLSSWLVWTHGGFENQRVPLTLYGVNMLFNLAWNPTFFLFHAMQAAFWDALGKPAQISLLSLGWHGQVRRQERAQPVASTTSNFHFGVVLTLRTARHMETSAGVACHGSASYVGRDYELVCAGIVATLALMIPAFYRVEPLAGLLLLPYLAWATFALFLNSTLINLNPQVCL